jgi:hypothetical protein
MQLFLPMLACEGVQLEGKCRGQREPERGIARMGYVKGVVGL